MKYFTLAAMAAAVTFAISTSANAHRPDDFDGGKTADFRLIAAKNKAKLLEAQAASGASSLSATAALSSAATTSSTAARRSSTAPSARSPSATARPRSSSTSRACRR